MSFHMQAILAEFEHLYVGRLSATIASVEEQTLIFLGPQGSGKGTQIQMFEDYIAAQGDVRAVVRFGMGKALREFAQKGSYTAEKTKASMERGELQPLFLASALFAEDLIKNLSGGEHLIVDGFPREENQLAVFDSVLRFYERKNPTVLNIVISDEVAIERLMKRGRSDDELQSIKNRLAWNAEQGYVVNEWFSAHPRYRYIEINGNQSPEAVHQEVLAALKLS